MKGWRCNEMNERRKEVVVVQSPVYLAKETKLNQIPILDICIGIYFLLISLNWVL